MEEKNQDGIIRELEVENNRLRRRIEELEYIIEDIHHKLSQIKDKLMIEIFK